MLAAPMLVTLIMLVMGSGGCQSQPRAGAFPRGAMSPQVKRFDPAAARRLVIMTDAGSTTWNAMIESAGEADVIILGETHDDAMGHAVQLALYEELLARFGAGTAVSMEMLERDEQVLIDDYRVGIIDAETLAEESFSADWAGAGTWKAWYQPLIDAAKDAGAVVIAANAPRRYVRVANREGYAPLEELGAQQRGLFVLPELRESPYRERFLEEMRAMIGSAGHGDGDDDGNDGDVEAEAVLERLFAAQSVWDATMAGSIVDALRRDDENGSAADVQRVVHLVGQFHSDFEGGLVQELRRRDAGLRVMTVSLRPVRSDALLEEDAGRANFVVYTGE